LNNKLLRKLLAEANACEVVSFEDENEAPISYAHPAQAV
jgi:UDP-3-O-[3-hydroxymyristoyl] N-acetylglucosamine deacetylase